MNIIQRTALALSLSILAACGGGGSSETSGNLPRTATLKLATTGTPSAQLSGLDITVTLPDGVTPSLDSDGSVTTAVATVSGVATPGTFLSPLYTKSSGIAKGTLRLVMASNIAGGFGAGEFATITLMVAAGSKLVQSDFSFPSFIPVDINYNHATGLTAVVTSLAVQ